jgi:uncharacterized protein
MKLIGRDKERKLIANHLDEDRSHFMAVYGRRRVGKTFLIKQYFQNDFTFYCTGASKGSKKQQINNFVANMRQQLEYFDEEMAMSSWYEVFSGLATALSKIQGDHKKVIFLDELPWMDTQGSDFLLGLEYFWNSWASDRKDIFFIVCGSSTSWIINKLFGNTGGLYNRVTIRMKINPFTLEECARFFEAKGFMYSHSQCIEAYMVFGGIPFYLDQFKKEKSPLYNIDDLCFGTDTFLKEEYYMLFKSLFKNFQIYINVIEAICLKNKGLTREEIAKKTKLSNGGSLSKILLELEHCNFIRKYQPMEKKTKGSLYQVIDPFCLFYNNLSNNLAEENHWINNYNSPQYHSWSGYAFEIVCLNHLTQIKKALGINGIKSTTYSWQNAASQIDLIIDRSDSVVNLFEIKYSQGPYVITKKYDLELRNKIEQFRNNISSNKAIWPVFLSPYGLGQSPYNSLFLHALTSDVFFNRIEG